MCAVWVPTTATKKKKISRTVDQLVVSQSFRQGRRKGASGRKSTQPGFGVRLSGFHRAAGALAKSHIPSLLCGVFYSQIWKR